jgi:hypothetical protein
MMKLSFRVTNGTVLSAGYPFISTFDGSPCKPRRYVPAVHFPQGKSSGSEVDIAECHAQRIITTNQVLGDFRGVKPVLWRNRDRIA